MSKKRIGNVRLDNLGPKAPSIIGNLCFTMFILGLLIITIISATHNPEESLHKPSDSTSDDAFYKSQKDSDFTTFINITEVADLNNAADCENEIGNPIDCRDPEVFNTMMRAAIEQFKDIQIYRFGKPVPGLDNNTCDMAWRYLPKDPKMSFYKDYRRFVITKSKNCSISVENIGEYHTGENARKKKNKQLVTASTPEDNNGANDTLPVVESETEFKNRKYLIYSGGGDRCKSMNHFLWSFLCSLGEAQYLNRTLVMDLSICLSSIYTRSGVNEEGKDFRYYFDFEHLKQTTSVLDQAQFWTDWNRWSRRDNLTLHLVEDFRITPMRLIDIVQETLIMRKFGMVEPDNYWYRVCEGEAGASIQRPWHLLWKSRRLMDVVSTISSRLNWDYDSIHVVRGEKARNKTLWPNLDGDTSPRALLASLRDKVEVGRHLYIATNEPDPSFFEPLRRRYIIHFLDEFKDLWDDKSEWHMETRKINGFPVEFDGYMRICVDTEVFLRGQKQIETFNDLTTDCKDGVNTCRVGESI